MTPEELRAIMNWLRQKVYLRDRGPDGQVGIGFDGPTADEADTADLNREACRQILDAPRWDEMLADIVETPEMCDPEHPPEQVLQFARDVVSEYIRKRASLEWPKARRTSLSQPHRIERQPPIEKTKRQAIPASTALAASQRTPVAIRQT